MRVFENMVPKKVLDYKREKLMGRWKKMMSLGPAWFVSFTGRLKGQLRITKKEEYDDLWASEDSIKTQNILKHVARKGEIRSG